MLAFAYFLDNISTRFFPRSFKAIFSTHLVWTPPEHMGKNPMITLWECSARQAFLFDALFTCILAWLLIFHDCFMLNYRAAIIVMIMG